METHVRVLAILNIVLGGLGILAALAILALFGGVAGLIEANIGHDPDARLALPILGIIAAALCVLLAVISLPGIIAGVGLLQFREWARILTIVLSALNLLNIPFGTALGIYGLWVLLSDATQPLFRRPRVT
ncbi:MAG: hypothetical protein AAB225_18625 [Acidobacteriota bacterium]